MERTTYINILVDTLNKKNVILDELLKITQLQEKCIVESPQNFDLLDKTFSEKDKLILQLNEMDKGFELVYNHVREELINNKLNVKDEIVQLKQLISIITEKSTRLQAAEYNNKSKLDMYVNEQKNNIKNFKINNKTVSKYYKNTLNGQQGQSYFYDKKK